MFDFDSGDNDEPSSDFNRFLVPISNSRIGDLRS